MVRELKVDRTARLPAKTLQFLLLWSAYVVSVLNFFVSITLVCYFQAGISLFPCQKAVQISADGDF